jgi:hypothetical protein
MGRACSIELVQTKPVLWEERCTGVSPRSTMKKIPTDFFGYPNHDPKCIRRAIYYSTWGQTGEECASS